MFDKVASRYDLINRVATFGLDGWWRRSAAATVASADPRVVLDVGAGTGKLTMAVANRLPESAFVVGLDFSQRMLGICRDRISGSSGIALAQARAQAMPLHDCSADVVCSAFALRNLEPVMDGFLSELTRVLRPGGRIVLMEIGRPTAPIIRGAYGLYLSWVLPLEGRLIAGGAGPYYYLGGSIKEFPKPGEYCERLERAGFRDVGYKRRSMGIATIYTGSKRV